MIAALSALAAAAVPTGDASGAADAGVLVPAPLSVPTRALDQPVAGAEGLKNAVAAKSGVIGNVIDTLDHLAVQIGSTRISVWDMTVVMLVLMLVGSIAWGASKLTHRLITRATRLDMTQRLLIEKMVSLVIWAMAILVGVDMLGIDLTALTVFSGAFGLAIGFGLQKTFGNLFAGIILLMDRSIKPGDVIAITDQAGNSTFGQIRRIGIRAVSLTTRDMKEYLIPNENLMINQVENWSYSSKNVRVQVPVGIAYSSDIEKAEELMLQAARSVKRILVSPPPSVWLDAYGNSSVDFIIHCWISDPEEGIGNVRSQVLKALWYLFQEHGIEIPFPQRDLNLRENEAFRELLEAMRKT
ncbi:mechanosensitive ion channel family protein [Novosphingobium mangrovi (ex Huang et al. 2023)]|uniref:Mechanosensitive ion channel n=1 Tax=Novosphingobium mangrovi (ex Huang et al. 2023) TaxID=2976432 RepID=A0ABT2I2A7_9SPHN|nr:mechanosensitive ion channel domain-containing protein [Novosphingobium mangrovi (ex Huang et al. 2023)]MCT2398928.1 mechanosensitive ion channel [Novosphingobium mangrovi (ex Huang et al. 2023)]